MSDLNRWTGIGRLGKDPDIRALPNGDAAVTFNVATTERWKNKAGEKQDLTEWTRCVAYRQLGEICGQYLTKGKQVYVAGKKRTRQYDKDGQTQYIVEVIVDQMQMLGSKGDQPQQPAQQPAQGNAYGQTKYKSNRPPVPDCPQPDSGEYAGGDPLNDEIPF